MIQQQNEKNKFSGLSAPMPILITNTLLELDIFRPPITRRQRRENERKKRKKYT